MSVSEEQKKKDQSDSSSVGFMAICLFLTIVASAVIWIIYASLPFQYYLPASFLTLVVSGVIAYVILIKRIHIS